MGNNPRFVRYADKKAWLSTAFWSLPSLEPRSHLSRISCLKTRVCPPSPLAMEGSLLHCKRLAEREGLAAWRLVLCTRAVRAPSTLRFVELRSHPSLVRDYPPPTVAKPAVGSAEAGGEGGIRTLGSLSTTHDFQSCTFDHSVTSPGAFARGRERATKS